MEDLRRAALAYYNNSSPEIKALAWNFFTSMDSDRDGRVSLAEFAHFIHCNGYGWVDPRGVFAQLDSNRDGGLDFWDVLTFYYIVKTRGVWCRKCHAQLHALYFTCVDCFDSGCAPFDLCSDCYASRSFCHEHRGRFLDSFVLLRSKIGVSPGTTDVNQVSFSSR